MKLVELTSPTVGPCATSAGVNIKVRGFTVSLSKGFDPSAQIALINLLQELKCSVSAIQQESITVVNAQRNASYNGTPIFCIISNRHG